MPRSPVLTGRIDARDRAQQRHRLDRYAKEAADPEQELVRFLDVELSRIDAVEAMERYDLTDYLRRTGLIDLPPDERLRQLAIAMEERTRTRSTEVLREWSALDRIYEAALRLDPDAAQVWTSRAITAEKFMGVADEPVIDRRLAQTAKRALERAIELEPEEAHHPWIMGHLVYHTREPGKTEAALEWLDRALALDPEHTSALLYRAHCLHDLTRWRDAIDAYDAVPLDAFVGHRAWIADYVPECRADCRLRAGDREGALADFERVLHRYELEPGRAALMLLLYLENAAEGELRAELGERFDALRERLGRLSRPERHHEDDDGEDETDRAGDRDDGEEHLPHRDR